jgi:hypothetical protein
MFEKYANIVVPKRDNENMVRLLLQKLMQNESIKQQVCFHAVIHM